MLKMHTSRSPRELLFISLLLLASFLVVAYFRTSFAGVNLEVNVWAVSVNSGFFTPVALAISIVFDTTALAIASVAVAAILFFKQQWKYGLLLPGAMAGDALLVAVCKTLIASPRPVSKVLDVTGYSFPSGHVAGSVVFFGVITYLVWKHWRSLKIRASTVGLYITIVGVVGFDRIYLNVHWLTDVVGAAFLGSLWLAFSIAVFSYLTSKRGRGIHLFHKP
jgi:undecaprenyl-diphosphatase